MKSADQAGMGAMQIDDMRTIAALREGLRHAGFRVSDIRRIVLTHAHEDHCGLARSLRDEAKDAEVLVHDWETGHRAGRASGTTASRSGSDRL